MSNYQLYQEALTSTGQGTPLWEPSCSVSQTSLRIGDVGYLRFGAFVRLFNATLPPAHQDNENGDPENYVPLVVHPTQLRRTVLPRGVIAASGVQITSSDSPDKMDARIAFKCTSKVGAVVMTDEDVIREDVTVLEPFADYVASHAHNWVNFARDRLMRDVVLHELILLTGCDLTKGRYSVTVFNEARTPKRFGHGASFQLSLPASRTHAWTHPPSIGYFQHNYGPSPSIHSSTQCLFIRGFKMLDRHVERMEQEESRSYIADDPAQYHGPLDAILRYLCDNSNADVAITHDLDLVKILQKDRVSSDYKYILKRLRKGHQPFIVQGPVASLL